jgi:hypothetical protein
MPSRRPAGVRHRCIQAIKVAPANLTSKIHKDPATRAPGGNPTAQ